MKNKFSNPNYQPQDFTELKNSEIGYQLDTMRLVDKIAKQLDCPRNEIVARIKKLTGNLNTENQNKEDLEDIAYAENALEQG